MSGIDSLLRQVASFADDVPAPDVSALRRAGDRRRRRTQSRAIAAAAAGVVAVLVAATVVAGQGRDRAAPPPVAPVKLTGSVAVPDANGNLVAVGPGGTTSTVVSQPGPDVITNVVFDRTGTRLLFVTGVVTPSVRPKPASWLYVARADGSHVRKLGRCPGDCTWANGPTFGWSPAGDRVLVANPTGVYLVSVPGGDVRQLDVGPGLVSGAAWSPDGTSIAVGVGSAVRSIGIEGTGLRTLATGLQPGRIDWSPDGTRLAVSGTDVGVWAVPVTAAADGAEATQVVRQRPGEGPAKATWSPDGTRLAYFTTPRTEVGFVPEVHTVAADGTDDRPLYRGPCCVSSWGAPAWSPDGAAIAIMVDTDDPSTGVHGMVALDVATGRSRVVPVRYVAGDPAWYPFADETRAE